MRRDFLGVGEGRTVAIASRVWRTIGIVVGTGNVVIGDAIGWTLVTTAGFPSRNNIGAAK